MLDLDETFHIFLVIIVIFLVAAISTLTMILMIVRIIKFIKSQNSKEDINYSKGDIERTNQSGINVKQEKLFPIYAAINKFKPCLTEHVPIQLPLNHHMNVQSSNFQSIQ